MDKLHLDNKLRVLGYDKHDDCLASFNELVLKLEDEQIKHYSDNKRDKFKKAKGSEFTKMLKTYLNELNVHCPEGFFTGNQLKDRDKLDVLNKLVNLAIDKNYAASRDDIEFAALFPTKTQLERKPKDDQSFVLYKVNEFLESFNLPPLDEKSKHSKVESALDQYLKYIERTKAGGTNATHTEHDSPNRTITELSNSTDIQNDFKKHMRTLYTRDLCTLQSEIIWLTKEFTKLPAKQ